MWSKSLIGALLIDGGLDKADAFIRRAWAPYVESQGGAPKHPKSALQELAAARDWAAPDYEMERKSGAHHAPRFTVRVSIAKVGEATAEGSSKQEAETFGGRCVVGSTAMSEDTTRAGFVAVIGAPNAGKSTLVNALVGQKVAIVSAKAQTTRARLMGIAIQDKTQVLLVDTPGIFEPKRRLDRAMVAAAWGGAGDADLILLVVDADGGLNRAGRANRRKPAAA